RVTQSLVCLDCVQPMILQVVGVKLVEQTDAPSFLMTDVEDDTDPIGRDHVHCRMQLGAAIAAEAAEDVPGQALRWGSQQHRPPWIDFSEHESEMVLVAEHVLV